jgi:iron complex outermembrane receptor protein
MKKLNYELCRFSGLIGGVVASLLIAGPTYAAESDEEKADSQDIEELIVTATRRETNVMETPFAIQVFSGLALEEANIIEPRDLYDHVPGLTMQSDNGVADHTIQLRGAGVSSVGPDDGMSTVGTYLDDVPWLNINGQVAAPIDYFDVKRIEFQRGPQGTSWGQDSTGGSIRVHTNDPDLDEFTYKVRAGFSDRSGVSGSGHDAKVIVNIPVVENVFGLRFAYADSYDQGYGEVIDTPSYDNPSEYDRKSWRIKALWTPNDDIRVAFAHSYFEYSQDIFRVWHQASSDTGVAILRPLTNRFTTAYYPNGVPENGAETNWTSLNVQWDLGFAQLQATTGYARGETGFNGDSGGPTVGLRFDTPSHTFTQELRLVSSGDTQLSWLAGLYYHDTTKHINGIVDLDFGAGFNSTYASIGIRASEAWSTYGEVSYKLTDQWVVLLGLRYYDDTRDLSEHRDDRSCDACLFGRFEGPEDPLLGYTRDPTKYSYTGRHSAEDRTFDFDNWNPRLNVTYYPNDAAMVYLNAATGFRAPVFHRIQQAQDLEAAGFSNFATSDGTEVTSIEIGAKWAFLNRRVEIQAAIDISEWQDMPVGINFTVDDDGDGPLEPREVSGVPVPGGDVDITAYEFQVTWRAMDGLTLDYSTAYIDGEIVKDLSDTVGGIPDYLLDGNPIPNTSPRSHGINVNYTTDVMNTGWTLFSSANYNIRDGGFEPVHAANDWKMLRATVGVSKGPWSVNLSAQNLSNSDDAYTPAATEAIAASNGAIPIPRTVMLQVTYDVSRM